MFRLSIPRAIAVALSLALFGLSLVSPKVPFAYASVTAPSSWGLLAAGQRTVVLAAETGANATTLNNGTYFYNNPTASMGFAGTSQIQQSSADVLNSALDGSNPTCNSSNGGDLRLSWHRSGGNIAGGWRYGCVTHLNDDGSAVRAVFHSDSPSYYPSGPQKNISNASLLSGGWEQCYIGGYGTAVPFSTVSSACTKQYIILAGGVGANVTTLATPQISGSSYDVTSLSVSFGTVANASSYTALLYSAATGGTLLKEVLNYTSGSSITGLTANTTYHVAVVAVGNNTTYVSSAESSPRTEVTTGTPTFTVTYDANANQHQNGSTTGTLPSSHAGVLSGDSVTVLGNTGALAREGYSFNGWNTASNGSGTAYVAGDSLTVSANITLYAQWLGAPGAPSNLSGRAAAADGSVTLSWTAPTNNGSAITGYTVEKRVSGTSTWSSATDSDGNATNAAATISSLGSCVAYDFRVAATNAVGTGSFSSTASVTSFGSTGLTDFDESDFILTGGKDPSRSNGRPAGEVWSAEVTGSGASEELVLNEPFLWEFGAAWSGSRFDLAESFCVEADVFLGDEDGAQSEGADGIAFVLQPNDTAQGTAGGGLGYAGITPSFAVEYDTYWNPTEDSYSLRTGFELNDHMGLVLGGNADVHTAGSTTPTRVVDLEDEQWRATQIRWDADQRLLTVKLDQDADGVWDAEDTIYNNVSINLASTFASSNGLAYWGFTGSTGGLGNYQKLRNLSYSPATLAGNTEPTVSNPGSQSVAVGSSQTINLVLADNNETSQGQWRLSVVVGNSSAATATVSATSATAATVTVNGLINADTTVTVTAVDADGASATSAFALRVGTGTPSTQQNSNQRQNNLPVTPIVTPNVPGQPRLPLPPTPSTNPQTLTAPPQTQNTTSGSIDQPRALVGGVPAPVTTTQSGNSQLNVQTGSVQLGVLAGGGGSVQQNPQTNQPELRVPSGGSTSFQGGGLLPGSTLQVWLPGATNRELGRLPVAPDGTFQGEVTLSQPQGQPPLPIGRQVLQVTGFDANGNQTIVDMPVNIAQGPPTPELNRELGEIPALIPGQTLATSAGQPVAVNVIPFQSQNSVAVEGDGWNFSVNVAGGSGEVGGTPESPLIQFTQSGTGSVSGGGFLPETVASVWLFSDPTLLGTVTVAEDGSFTAEFLVDSQFIPAGEHTLQVQGVGEDGYIKAANLGVLVQEPAVATTASSAGTLLWWGLGALLVLAVAVAIVMIIARRKQA